jgi:molybdate transport system regulatory protein
MVKVTLRIDLGAAGAIGPGKIRLLELIRDTGSISAAGRVMDMSYRRAWLLIDALNQSFQAPVVATKMGGKSGGGATLTAFGADLVDRYRSMERRTHTTLATDLSALEAASAPRSQVL